MVPEPNRRSAGDFTTAWTRRDGVVAIVPTIDCGCRSILSLIVTKDQHGPQILASAENAFIAAFCSPENVPEGVDFRTDHGPQYTGSDCENLCKKWKVEHTDAPVGRPTGNAVVERVIRTMKEEVVWLRDWDSIDELRSMRGSSATTRAAPAEFARSISAFRSLRNAARTCRHHAPIFASGHVLFSGGHTPFSIRRTY